ncbi:MAG: J domain-containing protein [Pirellula sp.]|jgi:DnaJ-class molecular chaperone|nr:J domain-containing protein [Pirellula sp.]
MANDYYKTLGVDRSASQDDIAKAYRKLARKYHPDLNPDDQNAKKRFQEIQAAYDTLNDPEKRKKYDQFGEDYERYSAAGPFNKAPEGWSSSGAGFDFGDIFGGGGAGAVDLGDLFSHFGGGGPRARRTSVPRGHDIAAEIEVPLRTMLEGGEMQFQLQRDDKVESIKVKVPRGIEPGKKIRLRGQGGPMPGGKPGDLLLTIKAQAHPNVKLVGNNIELKLPITLTEAIQGAKIDVPTAKGTVTITIPPMSSSGKRLRIKGQGFAPANGTPGDMLVELHIKLPDVIPSSSRDEIERLNSGYPSNFRDSVRW